MEGLEMKKRFKILIATLVVLLALCIGFIIYIAFGGGDSLFWMSYQQSPNEIYNMESGIIYNCLEFHEGQAYKLNYDFSNQAYGELRDKHNLVEIAQTGNEFGKAKNLMNEFSNRLTHKSNYDNHIETNALALLNYSLDNKKYGINCRAKSQILNEMCLSLGIYARKVWIMPISIYDSDCHVVNEIWDSSLHKWIMFDITSNMYWVDENGNPLSILEIRDKIANQDFCTPVNPGDNLKDLKKSLNNNFDNFLYIAKNMVFMQYCDTYTTNESEKSYFLYPTNLANLATDYDIISKEAIEASPI